MPALVVLELDRLAESDPHGLEQPGHPGVDRLHLVAPDDPDRAEYVFCCTVCDRVGLSVWLRKSAVAVSATIAGRPFRLSTQQAQPFLAPGERVGTMFTGYLQPAGIVPRLHVIPDDSPIRWWAPSPSNAPSPPVELRIDYGNGRRVVTKLDVPLEAGWG